MSTSTISAPRVLPWTYDDGGRVASGKGRGGHTGDCVARSISIVFELPYIEVWDELHARTETWVGESRTKKARRVAEAHAKRKTAWTPNQGVYDEVWKPYVRELGGVWTPTMFVGRGTTHHLRAGEVPSEGRHIVSVSRHLVALVDGVVRDIYDPSRDGDRCVYGWWTAP